MEGGCGINHTTTTFVYKTNVFIGKYNTNVYMYMYMYMSVTCKLT